MTAEPHAAVPARLPSTSLQSLVLVGPTASGKSALALEVCELLGDCEIVSVDSMQVYREMDIGTATPSPEDLARVTHHLVNIVDPSEEYSVAEFQGAALTAIDEIGRRGHRAVLVGGTGLYHRAVLDRLEIPGQYPDVLGELDQESDTESLHERLRQLDPAAASRMEPTNRRRILRALEVSVGSGRPFSSFGPGLESYPALDHLIVGLSVPRDRVRLNVGRRVDLMMENGFEAEVRALASRTGGISRTAGQALGYREMLEFVHGATTRDDAVAATVARTRQFAVRQDRWFRRDPRIEWFDHETPFLAARIADTLGAS